MTAGDLHVILDSLNELIFFAECATSLPVIRWHRAPSTRDPRFYHFAMVLWRCNVALHFCSADTIIIVFRFLWSFLRNWIALSDFQSLSLSAAGISLCLRHENITPGDRQRQKPMDYPPAPGIWCGDSDYTWVSGWYPTATELTILKGIQNLLVFMRL